MYQQHEENALGCQMMTKDSLMPNSNPILNLNPISCQTNMLKGSNHDAEEDGDDEDEEEEDDAEDDDDDDDDEEEEDEEDDDDDDDEEEECDDKDEEKEEGTIEEFVDDLIQTVISNLIKNVHAFWFDTILDNPNMKSLSVLGKDKFNFNNQVSSFSHKEKINNFLAKQDLHILLVGEPASGKTTLMVQLLFETEHIFQLMNRSQRYFPDYMDGFDYFVLNLPFTNMYTEMEGLQFETRTKVVTILDIAGHKDFIPNMIVGTVNADFALVIVDGTFTMRERKFKPAPVLRSHLILLKMLSIHNICVLVNKLDLVKWSEERFEETVTMFLHFLEEYNLNEFELSFIPCSALFGKNMESQTTEPKLCEWYSGECLFDVLDDFIVPKISCFGPLRMPVHDITKMPCDLFSITGTVQSGLLCVNDRIVIGPSGKCSKVKDMLRNGQLQTSSMAGDDVILTLTNFSISDIGFGSVIYDLLHPMKVTTIFEACIYVFNIDLPLFEGDSCFVFYQTLTEPVFIRRLIAEIHNGTNEVFDTDPGCLFNRTSAILEIETRRPMCIDCYHKSHHIGKIMLMLNKQSIATGIVTKIHDMPE